MKLRKDRGDIVIGWSEAGPFFAIYILMRIMLRLLLGEIRRNHIIRTLPIHYYTVLARNRYTALLLRHEPHVRRVIKQGLKDGQTFIDVGAFLGFHTLYAYKILRSKKHYKIIAVEPYPPNYNILKRKIDRIKAKNIILVDEAIYIKNATEVEFYRGGLCNWFGCGESPSGSVLPTKQYKRGDYSSDGVLRVRTVRLDSLINRFGLKRVDLIKMDIEGAEYHVLTDPTLDLSKVENLIVEVHYNYMSRESHEIIGALTRKGFKIVPLYPNRTPKSYHLLACRDKVPW
jgi:FkbM family methyltransferase